MGTVNPLAHNVEDTWHAMLEGRSAVRPTFLFDASTYPTTFSTTQFRAIERVFQNLGYGGDALNMAWDEANAATLSYFYE